MEKLLPGVTAVLMAGERRDGRTTWCFSKLLFGKGTSTSTYISLAKESHLAKLNFNGMGIIILPQGQTGKEKLVEKSNTFFYINTTYHAIQYYIFSSYHSFILTEGYLMLYPLPQTCSASSPSLTPCWWLCFPFQWKDPTYPPTCICGTTCCLILDSQPILLLRADPFIFLLNLLKVNAQQLFLTFTLSVFTPCWIIHIRMPISIFFYS